MENKTKMILVNKPRGNGPTEKTMQQSFDDLNQAMKDFGVAINERMLPAFKKVYDLASRIGFTETKSSYIGKGKFNFKKQK